MNARMLLQTENLTKDYGPRRALDRLTLSVGPGEIFSLLGPNGSGKSTAIRIMMGFLRPTAGRATIAGHDCWKESVTARREVSYLPGELRLYENMSGKQLVRFLGQLRGRFPKEDLARLARQFDIDIDRPIADLSSGMKRKIALLVVLLPRTPLVILDEPTNTLDPTMRDELLGQLLQAKERGQAILFSSHVLSEVERVCDRVGILKEGRLVHLQDMKTLRQGRLIRVRFERPCGPLPTLEGLHLRERNIDQFILEYTGPLPPMLDWLGHQPVADLVIEPLGLSSIYHRYHGAEQ